MTIPRLKSHPSSPWGAHIWFRSHSMVTVVPIEATKGELWTSAERAYPFFCVSEHADGKGLSGARAVFEGSLTTAISSPPLLKIQSYPSTFAAGMLQK